MKPNATSCRLFLVLVSAVLAFSTGAPTFAGLPAGEALFLRVPASEEDVHAYASEGFSSYGWLYGWAGQDYLLLEAESTRRGALTRLGFDVEVLYEGSQAHYFLLYDRMQLGWGSLPGDVRLLSQDGRRALVASDAGAPAFDRRYEVQRLWLHPLAVAPPRLPRVATITPHPIVSTMIGEVTGVYDLIADLSGEVPVMIGGREYTIATRYTPDADAMLHATQYAYEYFDGLGLAVSYHEYAYLGGPRRNVIAEQPGVSNPACIYLITAHLDDTSSSPFTYAPGADDNASGSAGVMLTARVLRRYSFACTLRYALFTGEEQGLYGSEAYAKELYAAGENALGVLNLDMIGYNSDPELFLNLHTRPGNAGDLAIANAFAGVVSAYGLDLAPVILEDGIGRSDHVSFWSYGMNAILAIEDEQDFTPYYHTTLDRVDTLDIPYATSFMQASAGTMAHLGGVLAGELQGVVTGSSTGQPLEGVSVQVEPPLGESWESTTNAAGGYHFDLPVGVFTVTFQAAEYAPFTEVVSIQDQQTWNLNASLSGCDDVDQVAVSYSPASPIIGEMVYFTADVTGGTEPISITWNMGDSTEPLTGVALTSMSHSYPRASSVVTYSVQVSAYNGCGVPAQAQLDVVVIPLRAFLPLIRYDSTTTR